jgi:hypothetical protein
MTRNRVFALLKREGVLLESSQGPVPNLVEFIAGEPVKGNWWSHPQSHSIFALTRSVRDSPDVLTCRAVNGKVTFVHRRVWPALVRLAKLFPKDRLAAICEVHTRKGAHRVMTLAFPKWVPRDVKTAGRGLSAEQAASNLGSWASEMASTDAPAGRATSVRGVRQRAQPRRVQGGSLDPAITARRVDEFENERRDLPKNGWA